MATHSSVLAGRIPWRATVHGVTESDTIEATGHTCINTACYFWDFDNPWVEVEFWCFICILLVTVKGKNSFTDFHPAHFFFHESTSHGFCLFCHWILVFFFLIELYLLSIGLTKKFIQVFPYRLINPEWTFRPTQNISWLLTICRLHMLQRFFYF